jgi:hypothetical protein
LAELSHFLNILSLMMAELTDKFCQYFERFGQKKTKEKVWPSCLAILFFYLFSSKMSRNVSFITMHCYKTSDIAVKPRVKLKRAQVGYYSFCGCCI